MRHRAIQPGELLATWPAAVLAQRSARGWPAAIVQLAFIYLAHLATPLLAELARTLARNTVAGWLWESGVLGPPVSGLRSLFPVYPLPEEARFAAGAAALLMALGGLLAWIPWRILACPASRRLGLFVRAWYRMWAVALVVIPLVAALLAPLPDSDALALSAAVLALIGVVLAPAWFTHRELHPRLRRRWRPVCPECGYSLRRLRSERCPECGAPFPVNAGHSRRWAWRRLPWDRTTRGSLLVACVHTVVALVVCPCRAAERVVIPDRFGRAVRWALLHLVLFALLNTAIGSGAFFLGWLHVQVRSRGVAPEPTEEIAVVRVAVWAAYSFVAWLVASATIPALGMALAFSVPGRHPAAKWALAKWSLYAVALFTPLAALAVVVRAISALAALNRFPIGTWFDAFVWVSSQVSGPSLTVAAVAYAGVWACGAAVNQYVRWRGLMVWFWGVLLFMGAWLLVTKVLFAPASLASLL